MTYLIQSDNINGRARKINGEWEVTIKSPSKSLHWFFRGNLNQMKLIVKKSVTELSQDSKTTIKFTRV